MAARRAMTTDGLKSLLERELDDSIGYYGSEITKDRAKALDYYYGRKTGTLAGEAGRSSVVSRDVLETVEWATAQLMQMFEGETLSQFEPEGPEDIGNAEQETDYVNHILHKDNPGFQLIHDWIKDGLLSRIGVVHAAWNDTPQSRIERYNGLLPDQLELLLSDEGTELVEKTERDEVVETPQGPQQIKVCDVRVRVETERGRVEICGIPTEEFRISRGVRSIEEIRSKPETLVAHVFECGEDKLRDLGFNAEQTERILGTDDERQSSDESLARDNPEDIGAITATSERRTTAWVSRCFMCLDWDGDGKAELREIYFAAKEIASNEPAEEIPYADWCPVPMPHRFSGQSYADLVTDLQEIRTALTRGALDNLYLGNNPMKEVVDTQVNIKDLLTTRIGGIVRVKAPGMIREIGTTAQTAATMGMLEYVDTQRENRTGLTRYNQGLDAETLNKTAQGMAQILTQSQIRLRLVARLFAERGMKRLVKLVHGLVRRHQDVPRVVRLRNTFVSVDPREWRERNNLTANVGLGAGTRQEQIGNLMQMFQVQMGMLQGGLPLVQPQNVFATLRKWTELLGYKDVQTYWTDPSQAQPQQQQPDPKAMELQMQMQVEQGKIKAQQQTEMAKLQASHALKMQEISAQERGEGVKLQAERQNADRKFQIEVAKLRQNDEHFEKQLVNSTLLKREELKVNLIGKTIDSNIEREAVKALGG